MSTSERPPDSFPEKRTFLRYPRWFPVTLTALGDRIDGEDAVTSAPIGAICRDASAGGILVSSLAPFSVGAKVEARFRVSRRPGTAEHVTAAMVVRSDTSGDEAVLAFPFRLALRFLTPLPELSAELATPEPNDAP